MAVHVNVIGSQYCNADSSEIGMVSSVLPMSESNFLVTDMNNKLIFRVNDTSTTFHKQRALVDAAGTTIVTFRHKQMSAHHRWQAFRGDSIDKDDLIFKAKQSSMIHSETDLNIYLPSNEEEKVCDYRVDTSFKFYAGDSDTNIIAEAKEHTVKVEANVDISFIASLVVLLDGISQQVEENRAIRKALLKGGAKGAANAF